jgi:hypothetical protein
MAGAAVVAIAAWFASGGIRPLGARPLETASLAEGDTTKTLVEAQVKLAKKALRLIEDSRQIGAPVRASSEERYLWSRRLLEAQIYLSLGAAEAKTEDVEVYLNQVRGPAVAERVKAFEAHLERMRQMEAWYRPLYERTQMSAFDFAKVEFTRLQAEVWLSREQSRPAEGAKPAR